MSRSVVAALLIVVVGLVVVGVAISTRGDGRAGSATPASGAGSPESTGDLVAKGEALSQEMRCVACHTTNGRTAAGPTWKGLYGSTVQLNNGSRVTADEDYLRESILDPDAKIVQGYGPGVMPPAVDQFSAQIRSDDNLQALVDYIKSLK